jgi:hypothetical protein
MEITKKEIVTCIGGTHMSTNFVALKYSISLQEVFHYYDDHQGIVIDHTFC